MAGAPREDIEVPPELHRSIPALHRSFPHRRRALRGSFRHVRRVLRSSIRQIVTGAPMKHAQGCNGVTSGSLELGHGCNGASSELQRSATVLQ